MAESVWKSTLEGFRAQVAGLDPVPAGVSAAAVSASLGIALLIKVLAIAKTHSDSQEIDDLMNSARVELERLELNADDDIAAYGSYITARRLPKGAHRDEAVAAALHQAIEVPLRAARAATAGLELCTKAAPLTPANIAPDLGSAAFLLTGAVRAILLSVDSNLLQLADPAFQNTVENEREQLCRNAEWLADSVLEALRNQ